MADVIVTYEGPTPAGGLSDAVQIEDKDGKTHLFSQGVPSKPVPTAVGKLASDLDGHKFKVEPAQQAEKKGD